MTKSVDANTRISVELVQKTSVVCPWLKASLHESIGINYVTTMEWQAVILIPLVINAWESGTTLPAWVGCSLAYSSLDERVSISTGPGRRESGNAVKLLSIYIN